VFGIPDEHVNHHVVDALVRGREKVVAEKTRKLGHARVRTRAR